MKKEKQFEMFELDVDMKFIQVVPIMVVQNHPPRIIFNHNSHL